LIPNNNALSKLPCKSRNGVERQQAVGRQVMMQFCPTRQSWNQFFGIYFLPTAPCAAHLLDFFSTVGCMRDKASARARARASATDFRFFLFFQRLRLLLLLL
jgi:hypothetical protein